MTGGSIEKETAAAEKSAAAVSYRVVVFLGI